VKLTGSELARGVWPLLHTGLHRIRAQFSISVDLLFFTNIDNNFNGFHLTILLPGPIQPAYSQAATINMDWKDYVDYFDPIRVRADLMTYDQVMAECKDFISGPEKGVLTRSWKKKEKESETFEANQRDWPELARKLPPRMAEFYLKRSRDDFDRTLESWRNAAYKALMKREEGRKGGKKDGSDSSKVKDGVKGKKKAKEPSKKRKWDGLEDSGAVSG
jgi:hypothetical protein